MLIRNKETGQTFEVLSGTLYAKNIFEEVKDEDIKVGEPKIEFEIEKPVEEPKEEKPKTTRKKTTKKTRKGANKDDSTK